MSRSLGPTGPTKTTELNALQLREQKLEPYLTMLDEIMATMPEWKEVAGHIYRLVIMTEVKDLDAAIRVHEFMAVVRTPQLVYVQTPPTQTAR